MKSLISILLIAAFISLIVFSCAPYDDIQASGTYAKLISKERHNYFRGDITRQYWQDMRRNLIYMEELPEGDTGVNIGTIRMVLVKR